MTSDAKIGLLLGLVFIFVIAFIINGLPNFGDRSRAEATPMMNIQSENFGVVDQARNAQERLDWQKLIDDENLVSVPTEAEQEPSTTGPDAAADGDAGDVRRVYTLDELVGGMSVKIQEVVKGLIETTPAQETTQPAPSIEVPTPEVAQNRPAQTATTPASTTTNAPGATTTPRPAAVAPKIYVVEDGDVLATVAKKAYGLEQGNRLVNINRIFEANRETLKTPDQIFVGQKLVIPPLPKTETAKTETGKTDDAKLSEALFEKVEQIGKRNVAEVQVPKPAGTVYVVQDGDSLWKIAAGQLGSGARWEEIVKLNTDALKSKDATLVIGMQLKLPPK